ncbi:uncharacterized protein G2W53_028107 [Senna tora]|uniref:Uncharacterized protein n=1 Tax=Senna tora TaxID=362788 RepID=A0A834T2S0_9FABA|nr:uncharacterized protein G2W53_028107 [Senna tora]
MDWSLIFCVVLAPVSPRADEFIGIGCEGHIQIINDGKVYEGDGCSSDDDEEFVNLVNAVVESNLDLELGTEYLTSDHVFLWWDNNEEQRQYIEIKECGLYPVDDEEYQNLITSASGMGVGCSYQNNDEEEAQPPMKKSKH